MRGLYTNFLIILLVPVIEIIIDLSRRSKPERRIITLQLLIVRYLIGRKNTTDNPKRMLYNPFHLIPLATPSAMYTVIAK